jgi:prepilin-type N-terminal cleavage/methylation domain-containing protein
VDAFRARRKTQNKHTMKRPHRLPSRSRGFTLIELLVVISIIAIIAGIAFPSFAAFLMRAKMTAQMNNGLQIYKAMANFAMNPDRDEFPLYKDPDDPSTMVSNSNEAFELLLKSGTLDNKQAFFNPVSRWCSRQVNNESTAKKVQPGENDWCYVAGLRWSVKDSRWPILANAFSPGTTTYVATQTEKGGCWKGSQAVVIWADGSGKVLTTKEQGQSFFIARPDKPAANAFEQDGEWLSGDRVKVLYPAG